MVKGKDRTDGIEIPKPNEQEGLGIGWPAQETDMDQLKKYFEVVKAKM